VLLLSALTVFLSTGAQAAPVALVGATLHPVSHPVVADGALVIEDGRIVHVGSRAAVTIPQDASIIDVSGRHIIPGLVDSHSHIGGARLHEGLGPVQPAVSAVDAFDPSHDSVGRARAGGLTTVNVMPGSGKLMGGQTAYLKLRPAAVVDEMLLCQPAEGPLATEPRPPLRRQICGGMKMANGTNPQGGGGDPQSRMGAAYLQRKALHTGQTRLQALQQRAERPPRRRPAPTPAPELEGDALAEVVSGQRTVHFHTHRADDVVTILRLQREFGLEVVLHHVSEGGKVAEAIAQAGVPCSLIVIDAPGGKEEALGMALDTGAVLEKHGVDVAFHTDDPILDSRLFLRSAGLAVRGGMSPEGALEALTLAPARMMGLDERIGSLEPGKDADFVVLDGPPLSVHSHVLQTWIEGAPVFDRSTPEGRRLATGAAGDLPLPTEPR
jgi:imidazolonepropionase-like amidohydrolase